MNPYLKCPCHIVIVWVTFVVVLWESNLILSCAFAKILGNIIGRIKNSWKPLHFTWKRLHRRNKGKFDTNLSKDMRTREHGFGETREQENMFLERHENRRTWFFERQENMRTREEGQRIAWAKREQEVWLGVAQHSFLAVSSLKPFHFSLLT